MRLRAWLGLGFGVVVACNRATDPTVSAPLADAASVRLIWVDTGADWTSHLPLTEGYTARIKVRLFVADGREIEPLLNPIQMTFSFAPVTFATTVTADSVLLLEDITPTDTAGTTGDLTITLTESGTGTIRTFGTFPALIHSH